MPKWDQNVEVGPGVSQMSEGSMAVLYGCSPPNPPTCFPCVASNMIVDGQEGLFFRDGALRAGSPIQKERGGGLGSAGPGLLRGACGQPVLILLCRLHLDDLSGAIFVAALPLHGANSLRSLLRSRELEG